MSRAAIRDGKAAQLQAADASATRALEELQRIAFFDPAGCFDAAGNLLPLADGLVRDVQDVRCFGDRQAAKESQLDHENIAGLRRGPDGVVRRVGGSGGA